jgi:hypothetical protein
MTDLTQLIDKDFQAFINETSEYNFFVGLADYIKYVMQAPEAKPVIEQLESEWRREYNKLDKLEEKTLEELQKPVDEVLAYKNSDKNTHFEKVYDSIQKPMQSLEDVVNHKTKFISPSLPEAIADRLFSVIFTFKKFYPNTEPPFLQTYKNKSPRLNGYDGNKFSETLTTFIYQNEVLKDNSTLWFAWHQLALVYSALSGESRNEMVEAAQNENDILPAYQTKTISDYNLIANDWARIRSPKAPMAQPIKSEVMIPGYIEPAPVPEPKPYYRFLVLDKFRLYAKRFHSHLLHEFAQTEPIKQVGLDVVDQLNFDTKESILHFKGKDILIAKSKNTDPHYLLQTLFKEPAKLWNYDEVATDWSSKYDKKKWKKFYNAAKKVNQKVATKTMAEDFLETSKMTVNINKKYLLTD